jgi:Fe-S cluster assembly protein SufD
MTACTIPAAASDLDPYIRRFEQLEANPPGAGAAWLTRLRKSAVSYFVELGFPTIRDEEWRFTNISPLTRLAPVFELPAESLAPEAVAPWLFSSLPGNRLVFVNGRYVAGLSSVAPLPAGVRLGSLADALRDGDPVLQQHLGRYARCEENPFVALNTALFADGAFLSLPDGCVLNDPIQLLFVSAGDHRGANRQLRHCLIAGREAQARVIERYVSLTEVESLTNVVTEIVVGQGAAIDHCKLQDESQSTYHVATIHAHLDRAARFASHSISSGARITRNDIRMVMNGEGGHGLMNGLYLGRGDQLVDHHTVADHVQPRCQSFEFYHGILDGRSRGVFNGKIFVRKEAQKTDAKQTNRNLLLSDEATIDTKPQLEIFADDVKCTHGATVGQLDETALFYLRSRGIGLESARQILVHAFASDVISRIPHEPVQEQLENLLAHRLDRPHGRDA